SARILECAHSAGYARLVGGFATEWQHEPAAAGTGAMADRSGHSGIRADGASDGQPGLAAPVWSGHRGNAGELRSGGSGADSSGTAGMAEWPFRRRWLAGQTAPSTDSHFGRVSPGGSHSARVECGGERGSGQPMALAHAIEAAGVGGDPRFGA